jgi:hypothetical protein
MMSLPNTITDEDAALTWWETEFANCCDAIGAQVSGSMLTRAIVNSIKSIRKRRLEQCVSLTEAARQTGYSADHLGRLVRKGKIRNVGRKGSPRLLIKDVPQRRAKVATATSGSYDPGTDARSLRVRR